MPEGIRISLGKGEFFGIWQKKAADFQKADSKPQGAGICLSQICICFFDDIYERYYTY